MLDEQYSRLLPDLAETSRRWLAKLVCAVVESGACTEPALATALQRLDLTTATNESAQVAVRRALSDSRLSVADAYAPLVRETLRHWPADQILLIIDATTLKARLVRLQASVAYQGRAVPVSWACLPGQTPLAPTAWPDALDQVLRDAEAVLPSDRPVRVLLDRGFTSPAVWDAVRARGWHPVLRVQRTVRLRRDGVPEQEVGILLGDDPGLETAVGQVFKKGGWREATVTALRQDGQPEQWLLVSDLPPGEQRALEYAVRMHIEESFRDEKRQGWQWEQSRIRDLGRAECLLLVLHLASLWCLSCGATAVASGEARRWVRPSRPAWSLFRIGWHWLRHALARFELVPMHQRLRGLPTWRTPLLQRG
jgi:hypothetical protein